MASADRRQILAEMWLLNGWLVGETGRPPDTSLAMDVDWADKAGELAESAELAGLLPLMGL